MSLTTAGHAEDIRAFQIFAVQVFFSLTGNNLGCPCNLKNIVKSAHFKSSEDMILEGADFSCPYREGQVSQLCIIVIYQANRVGYRLFGMIRTNPYTLSAIYASFIYDSGFALSYSDCFRGASFYAIGTTFTFDLVQSHRVEVRTHLIPQTR